MNLAWTHRYKYMINQNTGQYSQFEEICCYEGQKKGPLWMIFDERWKGGSLWAKNQEEVGMKRVAQLSSLKCWTENNFPHIIIHDSCFKGLNTCPLFCWKTVPKADRRKATVSLNYSHLCHLTLKSTKKDCFWVSMPFRRASNCSCPSWPSQSRLN